MTLAHRLAQHGQTVILFEESQELGWLACPWRLGNVVWDKHYHVILLSDSCLRSLLAELGLEQDIKWVETRTGFYAGGKLYSMSNALDFLRFPPLSWIGRLRLGLTVLVASKTKDWRRLESVHATEWLRRWSGSQTTEKIWFPLLRAKLGENYTKASAAFIWAIIARMYAARRTGLKKEMFGYVPGGYARILKRLGETLLSEGVQVNLGLRARKVEREAHRVSVTFDDGHREYFDQVVLTMPAPIAESLCSGLSQDESLRLRQIQYQGVICASLLLKQPLAGYYVTNIIDSWVPFTAVIEMSTLVDRQLFGGNSLVYLPKYVTPEDPLFTTPDQEIQE